MDGGMIKCAKVAVLPTMALLLTSATAPQADWLCQAKDWEASSIRRNWFREQNRPEDIFRLRILGPTTIRITGSDLIRNGNRKVKKSGSRYIFTDRVTTTNQFGFQSVPRGVAFFDASTGEISMESEGTPIMGIEKYFLIYGNCE